MVKLTMVKNIKRPITRSSLAQELMQRYEHLSFEAAESVIDLFFQEIINALTQNKIVTLRRFGTFKPKIRPACIARNPKTTRVAFKDN